MAAVSVFRGRSLRSRRLRGRGENGDENVTLDYSKGPQENLKEVLTQLVKQRTISKLCKLGYYNAYVRLCFNYGSNIDCGLGREQVLACLRLGLLHEAKEMRAACLRALRYFCHDEADVLAVVRSHTHYLIARSLDVVLDNEIERIHALRLTRRLAVLSPSQFPQSLVHAMVAIAYDGTHERDRLVRTCLATLCELALNNPRLVCEHGGLSAILRNVMDCPQYPRVNESMIATTLYLLNHPRSRHFIHADTDLEQMLAPFTDRHFRFSADSSESPEERESRFAACKMAVGCMMRSWPGIIYLCRPDSAAIQSLLGVLYLPQMDTRKELMDILFDVFRLPLPEWTDSYSQALLSIDPSEMREAWRLQEGFVAEEGKAVLPHLAKTRPNLVDNHLALVLASFISAGLLESLVEAVTTSEAHISVRATILLGELLHLANTLIPNECSQHTHCLPTLMALATSFSLSSGKRIQASRAVSRLNRLHAMKKRGSVPSTLYLDSIVQSGALAKDEPYKPLLVNKDKFIRAFDNQDYDHEVVSLYIKDSQVIQTRENLAWDWDLIAGILKWPDDCLRKLEDQTHVRFVRRLVYFYKPSNKLFPSVDLSHEDQRKLAVAGLYLIDFLVDSLNMDESQKFIEDLMGDINKHLIEVQNPATSQEGFLSPTTLQNTCAQYYFLFVGRLCRSERGEKFMESIGLYHSMLELISGSHNDCYVKLVVSCMDYTRDSYARIILSKAFTSASEAGRIYCIRLLRVFLRAQLPCLGNWGMELLVLQLYDQSKSVAMEALSVISEACEVESNLHSLVILRPSVLHLGFKGSLLLARFLSIPAGFKFLTDANYVDQELENWHSTLNAKYVHCVDERLNEALTTYEKSYDGQFVRRSLKRQPRQDVYVPVHLYGQLVQHKHGYQLLTKQPYILEYFRIVRAQDLHHDEEIVRLKMALWAVGHIGTSVWGLTFLQEQNIIPEIIKLAEESGVFSVRGTAYFVLGLVACTAKGADALVQYGWESVRHQRSEVWPVLEERDKAALLESQVFPPSASTDSFASSGVKLDTDTQYSVLINRNVRSAEMSGSDLENMTPNTESGCSPHGMFYMEDEQSRSRSSTGPTSGVLGSSYEGDVGPSPQHRDAQRQRSAGKRDSAGGSPQVLIHVSDLSDVSNSETEMPESSLEHLTGANKSEITPSEGEAPASHIAEVKARSRSMPEKRSTSREVHSYGANLPVSHPRSNSDPHHLIANKLPAVRSDSHVMVHFEDTQCDHTSHNHLQLETDQDAGLGSGEEGEQVAPGVQESRWEDLGDKVQGLDDSGQSTGSSQACRSLTPTTTVSTKSRSDSIQTDVTCTSSGISSMDSGAPSSHTLGARPGPSGVPGEQVICLTPIPSASSLLDANHVSAARPSSSHEEQSTRTLVTSRQVLRVHSMEEGDMSRPLLHPSELHRRLANLKRMPTLRRRYSNPVLGHVSSATNLDLKNPFHEGKRVFTSTRDLQGYATLRELKKHRTKSVEIDTDVALSDSMQETKSPAHMAKARSLDFRLTKTRREIVNRIIPRLHKKNSILQRKESLLCGCGSGLRKSMDNSLEDLDIPYSPQSPVATDVSSVAGAGSSGNVHKRQTVSGRAEYVGITLPMDISMFFQVGDGEDPRSCYLEETDDETESYASLPRMADTSRSVSQIDPTNDGLDVHLLNSCLVCYSLNHHGTTDEGNMHDIQESDGEDPFFPAPDTLSVAVIPLASGHPSPVAPGMGTAHARLSKSRTSSLSEGITLAGSISSMTSVESATTAPVMTENTDAGRKLIRKEVLRLVVNLGSSVGTKGNEQGLLLMRQKFPQAFEDACLYSEVCHLLASYNFRLNARRFIQDIFQEVDLTGMFKEPQEWMGVLEESGPDGDGPTEADIRLERVLESIG